MFCPKLVMSTKPGKKLLSTKRYHRNFQFDLPNSDVIKFHQTFDDEVLEGPREAGKLFNLMLSMNVTAFIISLNQIPEISNLRKRCPWS